MRHLSAKPVHNRLRSTLDRLLLHHYRDIFNWIVVTASRLSSSFGNLVAVVYPSPSCNNRLKVSTSFDNERINTILRIKEASEDTISEALFAPIQNACFLFSPLIL